MAAGPNCAVGVRVRVGSGARVIGAISAVGIIGVIGGLGGLGGLGAVGLLRCMVGNEMASRRAQPQPIFEALLRAYAPSPSFTNPNTSPKPNTSPNPTTTLAAAKRTRIRCEVGREWRESCGVERRRARAGGGRARGSGDRVGSTRSGYCE